MKDEAGKMKAKGGEPTAEAVTVVWPVAPEAERLSVLMKAKSALKPDFTTQLAYIQEVMPHSKSKRAVQAQFKENHPSWKVWLESQGRVLP